MEKTIGNNIRKLRYMAGYAELLMAEYLEISKQDYRNIESGNVKLDTTV